MKIFITALFCFSFTISTHAQDKIMFIDGTEILSKVIEINNNEIKYKQFDNQNGPTIITLKKNIFIIKYENGTKEVFTENLIKDSPTNIQVETELNTNYCVKKGNKIIDAFYGATFNNYGMVLLDNNWPEPNNITNKYCIGGALEYLVNDKIGIGAEITYRVLSGSADEERYRWDSLYRISENFKMDIKHEKLRTFAKINVHFYKTNKVDFYSNFGLGLVFERIEINQKPPSINYPNYYQYSNNNRTNFGIKAGLGLRVYISDVFGIHAELSIGGPIARIGFCYKL
jgi:hypothetical protein